MCGVVPNRGGGDHVGRMVGIAQTGRDVLGTRDRSECSPVSHGWEVGHVGAAEKIWLDLLSRFFFASSLRMGSEKPQVEVLVK